MRFTKGSFFKLFISSGDLAMYLCKYSAVRSRRRSDERSSAPAPRMGVGVVVVVVVVVGA